MYILLVSPLGYYELMELSPHVLINNNDVTSPVITVIFDVVLQVHVIAFVLFCDTLFSIMNKASSWSTLSWAEAKGSNFFPL